MAPSRAPVNEEGNADESAAARSGTRTNVTSVEMKSLHSCVDTCWPFQLLFVKIQQTRRLLLSVVAKT